MPKNCPFQHFNNKSFKLPTQFHQNKIILARKNYFFRKYLKKKKEKKSTCPLGDSRVASLLLQLSKHHHERSWRPCRIHEGGIMKENKKLRQPGGPLTKYLQHVNTELQGTDRTVG